VSEQITIDVNDLIQAKNEQLAAAIHAAAMSDALSMAQQREIAQLKTILTAMAAKQATLE